MKTKGNERTKRKAPPRRGCEVERSEKHAATSVQASKPQYGLSQLEYEALSLPAEEKIVRQDRFPLLLGISPAEVSIVLNRLRRLGMIKRERFLVKDPAPWVWLTQKGGKAAHISEGMARFEPGMGQLDHADAVVRARIAYTRKYRKGLWVPERELSRRHDRKSRHLVDGLVEPVKGGRKVIAIEVELTQKLSKRRVLTVSGLCTDPDYTEVHYLCSKKAKAEVTHAVEAVERQGVNVDNLKILDLPDLAGIA